MHGHLIVSRKDQTNKKKLLPLTNHKNTKKGIVTGGFDQMNLFQQAKWGFDKLFSYNRQQSETFEYCNMMKNGSIAEQIELQNQNFTGGRKKEVFQFSEKENNVSYNLDSKIETKHSNNQQNDNGNDTLLSILSWDDDNNYATLVEELLAKKIKKRKRKNLGFNCLLITN